MTKLSRDTWKSIYQLPLKADDWGLYVFSKNSVMSLSHFRSYTSEDGSVSKDRIEDIVSIINGKKTHYEPEWKVSEEDCCKIQYRGGEIQFLVRGWGYLIGCGGMHFNIETAKAIQDQFIEYVLKRLNGK